MRADNVHHQMQVGMHEWFATLAIPSPNLYRQFVLIVVTAKTRLRLNLGVSYILVGIC